MNSIKTTKRGLKLLSEEKVSALVGAIKDPILNVPLSEINGIKEIKIKEEIEHVSVKVAMAQLGGKHN